MLFRCTLRPSHTLVHTHTHHTHTSHTNTHHTENKRAHLFSLNSVGHVTRLIDPAREIAVSAPAMRIAMYVHRWSVRDRQRPSDTATSRLLAPAICTHVLSNDTGISPVVCNQPPSTLNPKPDPHLVCNQTSIPGSVCKYLWPPKHTHSDEHRNRHRRG